AHDPRVGRGNDGGEVRDGRAGRSQVAVYAADELEVVGRVDRQAQPGTPQRTGRHGTQRAEARIATDERGHVLAVVRVVGQCGRTVQRLDGDRLNGRAHGQAALDNVVGAHAILKGDGACHAAAV